MFSSHVGFVGQRSYHIYDYQPKNYQSYLTISDYYVCFHWSTPRPRPRLIPTPMELGFIIMLGSGYTKPMQIFIGSVHILSVSVSISGSVNEPLQMTEGKRIQCFCPFQNKSILENFE